MDLPSFTEFVRSLDMDKVSYDLDMSATEALRNPPAVFTDEQYGVICETMAAMMITYLGQYHDWLREQLL